MSRKNPNPRFAGTDIPISELEYDPDLMVSERRVARLRSAVEHRQPDLHLVLEDVHDPHNVSAVLRTCDAVGVGTVHMVYVTEEYPKLGKKSSASAWKWTDFVRHESIEQCYKWLRERGVKIIATDLAERAVGLYDLDLAGPVALVFGNEHKGVSPEASKLADANLMIPMVGMVQSLNISVACAVTLYETMRQRMVAGLYDAPQRSEAEVEAMLRDWAGR